MSLANDKLMDEVWIYIVSPVGIVLYLVALKFEFFCLGKIVCVDLFAIHALAWSFKFGIHLQEPAVRGKTSSQSSYSGGAFYTTVSLLIKHQ